MIKYIETFIKIIIFLTLLFFFYNFFKDVKFYMVTANKNEKALEKFENELSLLSKKLDSSREFYETNKIIIDSTRINDNELQLIIDNIFNNIVDKKLGFFRLVEQSYFRDPKVINVYTIKGTIQLHVDSLFSMDEAKVMINNQINKVVTDINNANINKIEIIPYLVLVENNLYKIELFILKKNDSNLIEKGEK